MQPEIIPADVRELLDTSIDSIEALDALMLLHSDPSRWFAVAEIAGAIDITAPSARRALQALRHAGLASEAASGMLFRLATIGPLTFPAFRALAELCALNRTAVVDHLARRSLDRLRLLADAFTRRRT